MKLKFDDESKAPSDAESFLRIVCRLRATPESEALRANLEHQALTQASHEEAARLRSLIAADRQPLLSRLAEVWHRLVGPSRREQELSRQRSDALARAERAELSSFDAVADLAQVERERDSLLERISRLENQARG